MLRNLSVRNLLLIEALDLEFRPGLNVLTGETGAGKSILLDSLGLALGWRGRADGLRDPAQPAEISAGFDLDEGHAAHAVLAEAGIGSENGLILRRVIAPDGRRTAYANDRRVTAETVRALADTLVELHGQQDDRGLLDPGGHLGLLDEFCGDPAALRALRAAWKTWRAADDDLERQHEMAALAQRDAEFLRHSAAELAKLAPQEGEEELLDARRRLMQAAARIRADIAKAGEALGLQGAEGLLSDAARWLDGATSRAEGALDAPIAALDRARGELAEAQDGVTRALEAMDFDPADLERTEERLFALRGLARKHGVMPLDLPGLQADFAARLQALDHGAEAIAAAQKAVDAARAAWQRLADAASLRRRDGAGRLARAVQTELLPLKLDKARFEVMLEAAPPGPEGQDRAIFLVSTVPGAAAGPINRVASGGELSRLLLALKVCLSRPGGGVTMIFDEIDRGIGGATADAVGRRLAALAEGSQVLVVTHSPQVAARGAHHWRVSKLTDAGTTRTLVEPLSAPDRVDELARMLSGEMVTEAARSAAVSLLGH